MNGWPYFICIFKVTGDKILWQDHHCFHYQTVWQRLWDNQRQFLHASQCMIHWELANTSAMTSWSGFQQSHDDVIKWKHFLCYWPFVRGIHQSLVNSHHKAQWRGTLMFSLNCTWINGWVNNCEAGDLKCHGAHCDITLMLHYDIMIRISMINTRCSCHSLKCNLPCLENLTSSPNVNVMKIMSIQRESSRNFRLVRFSLVNSPYFFAKLQFHKLHFYQQQNHLTPVILYTCVSPPVAPFTNMV